MLVVCYRACVVQGLAPDAQPIASPNFADLFLAVALLQEANCDVDQLVGGGAAYQFTIAVEV